MAGTMFVLIPLQDRLISPGQSIAVAEMALGKAVLIAKTNGTEDYVRDNVTGVFVKQGDPMQLRSKILGDGSGSREALIDWQERSRLGPKNLVIQKYPESLCFDLFAEEEPVG